MQINLSNNTIFCGDNLEWLKDLPNECVDLCYIDPPFFSNANYEIVWGNGFEVRSFGDRFSGGISHYIEWMRPRIEEIHRVLKKTGSIFLHCDWHASHRLRCLLDDIFGESNFRSEIIWQRTKGSKGERNSSTTFSNSTDSIYFFSKSSQYTFKSTFEQYSNEYIEKSFKYVDENGDRYSSADMRNPSYRPNLIYDYKGYKPHSNGWLCTKERMEEFDRLGRLIFPKTKDGRIRLKNYLKDMPGVKVTNLWADIGAVQSKSSEKLGYPTQKPEALIRRILNSVTNEGDLILDCFAGGGTTAKVAVEMKRRFLTGDVSPVAVKIVAQRIEKECPGEKFEVKGLYGTEEEFKSVDGHRFADLVCELTGWKGSDKKSGDKGIDAWDGQGNPVQIKNHKSAAGRPDLQKFLGAIQGSKKKAGQFVAWEFSRDAKEFVANLKQDKIGVEIRLMPCSEIFGPLLITKDKRAEIEKHYQERFPKNWAGEVTAISKDESLKTKLKDAIKDSKTKKKKES